MEVGGEGEWGRVNWGNLEVLLCSLMSWVYGCHCEEDGFHSQRGEKDTGVVFGCSGRKT